jgi:Skp family chaperone for outer membrane proteins
MSINNMFPVTLLITAAVLCIGVAHADDHADATASLKKEIAAFRTKTATIRKNIEHEKKKAAADSLSYAACLREQADRSDRLKAERDSLQKFSLLLQHRRDSLTETGAATALQKQSLARRGAHLLAALQANCRQLIDSLTPFSVYHIDRQIAALNFLEGEITSGTVTASEGIERYWRIVSQIEQASSGIECWNGTSPVAAVKGETRFIRMGFVWLACTANDNSGAFLYNARNKKWEPVNDGDGAAAIHKAIQLATGAATPQLVALPVNVPLNASSDGEAP